MHTSRKRTLRGWGCALGLGFALAGGGMALAGEDAGRASQQADGESLQRRGERAVDTAAFADALSLLNQKQLVLASLALERSQDAGVRRLAETLIGNHEQQLSQVETWADEQAVDLAFLQMQLNEEGVGGSGSAGTGITQKIESRAQKKLESLMEAADDVSADVRRIAQLEGKAFDEAFLSQIHEDQKHGLKLLDQGKKDLPSDEALGALVQKSKPVYEQQLASAEQAKKSLGKKK